MSDRDELRRLAGQVDWEFCLDAPDIAKVLFAVPELLDALERAERERDEALATAAVLREELECHTGCGLDFGADCDECGYHQNDRCVAHQLAHDARATLTNLPAAVAAYQEQRLYWQCTRCGRVG